MSIRKKLDITGPAMVFVTTITVNRIQAFHNKTVAKAVLTQLDETTRHFGIALIGYVLMPSHLHSLFGLPQIELLSKFVQGFKSLASRKVKELEVGRSKEKLYGEGGFRLWRPRFDDLIITSEKQFKIKLEYIHNNPVKGGLVNEPNEWLYSSAGDWLGESKGVLKVDKYFEWVK